MCLEPWNGTSISKKDTGLGNRLMHWASIYYLSSFFENVEIIVQDQYWPELEFLYLPNTSKINILSEEVKNHYVEISDISFPLLIRNKDSLFEDNQKYYFPKLFEDIPNSILYSGLKNIKFKESSINDFFKKIFLNVCAIHLRRGLNTIPSKGFVMESSTTYMGKENLKNYLRDFFFRSHYLPPENYIVIPDSAFFYFIEKVILKKKDQQIYISSDIPLKYYDHYFQKYPNNIILRDHYIKSFFKFFDLEYLETKFNNQKYTIKQTLINLFDLFSLAHSKFIVGDNYSTWSIVSSFINKKTKLIFIFDFIAKEEQISIDKVKKIYNYYPEYLNKLSMKSFRVSDDSSTLLDLIEDWHFSDNEKQDLLNLIDQITIWLTQHNSNNIHDEQYSNGWNDCLEHIKSKLK